MQYPQGPELPRWIQQPPHPAQTPAHPSAPHTPRPVHPEHASPHPTADLAPPEEAIIQMRQSADGAPKQPARIIPSIPASAKANTSEIPEKSVPERSAAEASIAAPAGAAAMKAEAPPQDHEPKPSPEALQMAALLKEKYATVGVISPDELRTHETPEQVVDAFGRNLYQAVRADRSAAPKHAHIRYPRTNEVWQALTARVSALAAETNDPGVQTLDKPNMITRFTASMYRFAQDRALPQLLTDDQVLGVAWQEYDDTARSLRDAGFPNPEQLAEYTSAEPLIAAVAQSPNPAQAIDRASKRPSDAVGAIREHFATVEQVQRHYKDHPHISETVIHRATATGVNPLAALQRYAPAVAAIRHELAGTPGAGVLFDRLRTTYMPHPETFAAEFRQRFDIIATLFQDDNMFDETAIAHLALRNQTLDPEELRMIGQRYRADYTDLQTWVAQETEFTAEDLALKVAAAQGYRRKAYMGTYVRTIQARLDTDEQARATIVGYRTEQETRDTLNEWDEMFGNLVAIGSQDARVAAQYVDHRARLSELYGARLVQKMREVRQAAPIHQNRQPPSMESPYDTVVEVANDWLARLPIIDEHWAAIADTVDAEQLVRRFSATWFHMAIDHGVDAMLTDKTVIEQAFDVYCGDVRTLKEAGFDHAEAHAEYISADDLLNVIAVSDDPEGDIRLAKLRPGDPVSIIQARQHASRVLRDDPAVTAHMDAALVRTMVRSRPDHAIADVRAYADELEIRRAQARAIVPDATDIVFATHLRSTIPKEGLETAVQRFTQAYTTLEARLGSDFRFDPRTLGHLAWHSRNMERQPDILHSYYSAHRQLEAALQKEGRTVDTHIIGQAAAARLHGSLRSRLAYVRQLLEQSREGS